jgi:nucleoside-diphosphate-sugar epimerase
MSKQQVVILGINGHLGHFAARAFVAAGWEVTGFGRSNRTPIAGVRFVKGDADDVTSLRQAIGTADVVVNALNLPYDKWDEGRAEAQLAKVIDAMGTSGKTLMFPGNVYNYAPSERLLTPETRQVPPTERGAIRLRMEAQLREAAGRGHMQVIILRAGDFYGPGVTARRRRRSWRCTVRAACRMPGPICPISAAPSKSSPGTGRNSAPSRIATLPGISSPPKPLATRSWPLRR